MEVKAYTYLFATPTGYVKVGSTLDIRDRCYQLRFGGVARYAPSDVRRGWMPMIVGLETVPEARRLERECQRLLARYRIQVEKPSRTNAGGVPEWFIVKVSTAKRNMTIAANTVVHAFVIEKSEKFRLFDLL